MIYSYDYVNLQNLFFSPTEHFEALSIDFSLVWTQLFIHSTSSSYEYVDIFYIKLNKISRCSIWVTFKFSGSKVKW